MVKITVIGANSYIARNLIHQIKKRDGFQLFLYDAAEKQADGYGTYSRIDILSKESLASVRMDCSIVFMFVGKTGSAEGFYDPDAFLDINERALLNVLNEYRRQGSCAKIIFPSTRLVYKGIRGQIKEDYENRCRTVYAVSKYACEQYLKIYHDVFGVQYCIFRICIPYGTIVEGASSYGTAEFMLRKAACGENIQVYGRGGVRRTLTYIGDLCSILMEGALSDICVNDVYNVGGEDYSLKEMAELIAEKYHVGIEYVPYPAIAEKIETGDTVFDSNKLEEAIGYKNRMRYKDWVFLN